MSAKKGRRFTRRYEMARDTVTDRAPRAFKEQALGSRRAERASEPSFFSKKADHSEQANQTPSQGVILRNLVGPPELARCASLTGRESARVPFFLYGEMIFTSLVVVGSV
jgi:hypothetical protein